MVTIDPKNKERFEKMFKGQMIEKVGTINGTAISIKAGNAGVKIPVEDALTAYTKRFKNW